MRAPVYAQGDGKVSAREFRGALPLLGYDASNEAMIDGIFAELDADGSGTRSTLQLCIPSPAVTYAL